ncbi:Excinuclease ABC C subunit domain protein [Leptothrix cholodnii SP-6]|uniref:Excinuclease cho n=1 Tax=Leptothrix cholodnii (strain ATCC 51168 / LMG 8142 / SP-6) TaxID=395495 RepID=B1XZE9_LEPCP|nr:nucleotide excision repair endonuclease [Leptothrix cholodnii]ACB36512.1 Excinuclease ABC C subunit domain protein [Leptothrix cholodnii SP-6]
MVIPTEDLRALPSAPGVYLFHGESALPLYIGKSVNIRSRVLSHLREPGEARMLLQTRRVTWIRTAGEIGALLLESRLIKAQQPLYNKQLRRSRELCSWRFCGSQPAVAPALVYSRDVDFAVTDGLFGLFRSAHAAKDFLIDTAQAHRLCLVALGLEPATRRGCFGLQLGRCDGVCVGRESAASHALRVAQALAQCAVQRWPFPGAVGLVERDGDWVQTHVVRNWRHERTLDVGGAQDARPPLADPGAGAGFDLDAYRILVKPLLDGGCERIHLED